MHIQVSALSPLSSREMKVKECAPIYQIVNTSQHQNSHFAVIVDHHADAMHQIQF